MKLILGITSLIVVLVFGIHALDKKYEYYQLTRSAVRIVSAKGDPHGSGSIITLPSGGHAVLTNWHVCRGAPNKKVHMLFTNNVFYQAEYAKSLMNVDLCIIPVPDSVIEGLASLSLSPKDLELYDPITVFGYPDIERLQPSEGRYLGMAPVPVGMGTNEDGTCPDGTESFHTFFASFCLVEYMLGHSNVIGFPGNSGSPVLNQKLQIVGVLNSGSPTTNHMSFVPLVYVREFLKGE